MSDTTPTHCGHDPRYIVQADEGTAYCALCELEAAQKERAHKDAAIMAFIRSLCLCDHLGDVGNEIETLSKAIGIDLPDWSDFDDLSESLAGRGVPFLHEIGELND